MATVEELEEQVNDLTTRLNEIENEAKDTEDFTQQSPLVLTSLIRVRDSGTTEYIDIQDLVDLLAEFDVTPISANHTAAAGEIVLVDASAGDITVTLPPSSGEISNRIIIKRVDSSLNFVSIDGDSAETIDDELTQQLTVQWESITIVSDDSNWLII